MREQHKTVLIGGGFDNELVTLDDLWLLDIESGRCEEVSIRYRIARNFCWSKSKGFFIFSVSVLSISFSIALQLTILYQNQSLTWGTTLKMTFLSLIQKNKQTT